METQLITLLTGATGLAALVSDRITWGRREQASPLPGVTLNKISGGPVYADDGEAGLDEIRVQIDCWGATNTSAQAVAAQVRAALSAHTDSYFRHCALDTIRDLWEGGANQAEYEYRVSMDFILLFGSE